MSACWRFGRRHGNPGVRHQRQQADRFERDRFPAGVGAADEQSALRVIQRERDGHHRFLLNSEKILEQRMPGIPQNQPARARGAQARYRASKLQRELRFREQQLQPADSCRGPGDFGRVLAQP